MLLLPSALQCACSAPAPATAHGTAQRRDGTNPRSHPAARQSLPTINIKEHGGVGDNASSHAIPATAGFPGISLRDCSCFQATSNTHVFKSAISAIAAAGGGTVIVPVGVFITGPFVSARRNPHHNLTFGGFYLRVACVFRT